MLCPGLHGARSVPAANLYRISPGADHLQNEQKLRTTFIETLGLDEDFDLESLTYRGIPEWDSVAHMQLIGEIETAFDIMLDTDDVIDMSSFVKAREIVSKYGVDLDVAPGPD